MIHARVIAAKGRFLTVKLLFYCILVGLKRVLKVESSEPPNARHTFHA